MIKELFTRKSDELYYRQQGIERFIEAQKTDYKIALAEIERGRKQSHWIWYIFPQLVGLGRSWFIGMVAVPCIYTFIASAIRLLSSRWNFYVDSMCYSPVMWFIVQPVTAYLVISLFRRLVILKKRGGTR